MHMRCSANTKYYKQRGVAVCERWSVFENFLADMGERQPGTSLDRINTNGNYEPDNCRWATHKEQAANRRPFVPGPKPGGKLDLSAAEREARAERARRLSAARKAGLHGGYGKREVAHE